jgi:hypothetical protein
LQTILLQNNHLSKYPPVLINIPSLKVVQLEGNPFVQNDDRLGKRFDEEEKTSEGSDSGLGSQEELLKENEFNLRENLKNENKNVRFSQM